MKEYLITFIAAMFAWWIIRQQDEPEVWFNAAAALACACLFILLCIGVMDLCACAM